MGHQMRENVQTIKNTQQCIDRVSYLIFVIFFTQAKFLESKIYTEKRVNYDKLHSKLPILCINYYKLHSQLPIFCVKSVKNLHQPKKIYTGAARGARDKYEVCRVYSFYTLIMFIYMEVALRELHSYTL